MGHTKAYQEFKKNGNTKFVRYSEGAEMWCQNINSTSQNEKFQIYISMVQQKHAEGGSHYGKAT